jgi:hypothetical protein
VIADESDRADHDRAQTIFARVSKVVGDVRLEPRIARPPAATLIDERPIVDTHLGRDQPRRGLELLLIARPLGHRRRNAVRGEHEPSFPTQRFRQTRKRLSNVCGVRRDPRRMIEPAAGVRDGHILPVTPQLVASRHHVLAILLATRIRMLRGGDEADSVAVSRCVHLAKRVGQQRMPVAHAHVYGQRVSQRRQPILQTASLPSGHVSDRRHTAEQLVVMRDFLDAFRADAPAAKHVGEEGTNVGEPLWTPERHDEH